MRPRILIRLLATAGILLATGLANIASGKEVPVADTHIEQLVEQVYANGHVKLTADVGCDVVRRLANWSCPGIIPCIAVLLCEPKCMVSGSK